MSMYGKTTIRRRKDGAVIMTIPRKVVDDVTFPFDTNGEVVRVYIRSIDGKKILHIEGT